MIHREGFIAKRSMEIPLEAINDVRFEQGIIDRIVGAGSLDHLVGLGVRTQPVRGHPPSGGGPEDDLPPGGDEQEADVPGHQAAPVTPPPEAAPAPPSGRGTHLTARTRAAPVAPSTTTELERLAKLRADGVLTEEEFQAQKAKILGQS